MRDRGHLLSFTLIAWPSIAEAHDLEPVLYAAVVAGGMIGLIAGSLSAWRSWHPLKGFLTALGLFVLAAISPAAIDPVHHIGVPSFRFGGV